MRAVCLRCLDELTGADDGGCPACGELAKAYVDQRGYVLWLNEAAGVPCMKCGEVRDLGLRRYRRVVGLLVVDRVHTTAGYVCAACARELYREHMGSTLVLGWWGMFAMLFRNPSAIATNLRARHSPPARPDRSGGVTIDQLFDVPRAVSARPRKRKR